MNASPANVSATWFARLAPAAASRMSRGRFLHSLGVMHAAVAMARRFGADPNVAGAAGLIHDIRKETPAEELRADLERAGWDRCPLLESESKLWHAWAGELFAAEALGIDNPEILGAIRYHPTGHPEMTPAQKIVFLADYMEPTRKRRPGLEEIRALARESLDDALWLAIQQKTDYLSAKNGAATVHPWSLAARNAWAPARGAERAATATARGNNGGAPRRNHAAATSPPRPTAPAPPANPE